MGNKTKMLRVVRTIREETYAHPVRLWGAVSNPPTLIERGRTHHRELRDHNTQGCQEVDGEVRQVVVGVVGAEQEQDDGHAEEEFLGRRVLVPVVDLLPHVEVVVCAGVELERDPPHPVEHDEGAEHVRDVGQRPRRFLRDTGYDVVEDLEGNDDDKVDRPSTCFPSQTPAPPSPGRDVRDIPLALTQLALRLGSAAWSLVCSMDSGGSW